METRLAEYKRELFEELTARYPADNGMKSHRYLLEFASDNDKSDRKAKRKKNSLDY